MAFAAGFRWTTVLVSAQGAVLPGHHLTKPAWRINNAVRRGSRHNAHMGARVIDRTFRRGARKSSARERQETRTFGLIAAAIVCPMFLAFILIGADMRTDLSAIKALPQALRGDTTLVGWADLETQKRSSHRTRMLGYVMDGDRPVPDGTRVTTFVLMPEAGHLMHPAHRNSEEMVEVHLAPGLTVPYRDRTLSWAVGNLERKAGKPRFGQAAWVMSNAYVQRAVQRDIARWFIL
ncbi:MAG: hypothetical protein JWN34_1049 [Bryobacterales bacterium]|nr:hypothetical protein [Bryobacterales bacterium]